jgi:hypothetical protein
MNSRVVHRPLLPRCPAGFFSICRMDVEPARAWVNRMIPQMNACWSAASSPPGTLVSAPGGVLEEQHVEASAGPCISAAWTSRIPISFARGSARS